MEEGESVLEAIYEDDNVESTDDVEMLDVEEGELVEHKSQADVEQRDGGGENAGIQISQTKNQKRRQNKKKNKKRKRGGSGQSFTDVNRFVLDTCRRLKEKKSYMVYTAVGCLGISALSVLVKEVDAVQSCGGQMTADGRRLRTGGGILWNLIKAREPMAYEEIMKKTKEFEKQFKKQNIQRSPHEIEESSSQEAEAACESTGANSANVQDGSQLMAQNKPKLFSPKVERKSIHDRIRVPVSYDDLLANDANDDSG